METKKRLWGAVALFAAAGFLSVPICRLRLLSSRKRLLRCSRCPVRSITAAKGREATGLCRWVPAHRPTSSRFTVVSNSLRWLSMWLPVNGLSPYLALRLDFMGGSVKKMWPRVGEPQTARYVALYGDLMWDLTNALGGYDPMRIVSFRPFAGVGAMYTFKNEMAGRDTYLFPVSAGININFRLCHYADFFIEGRANMMGNNFSEQFYASRRIETIVSAIAGITVNFGKERFCSYNPYAEQALVSSMNERINDLREELEECESRPLPPPEKVIIYKTAPAPA